MGGGGLQGIRSMGRNKENGVWNRWGPQHSLMKATTGKGAKTSPLGSPGAERGLKYSREISVIEDIF